MRVLAELLNVSYKTVNLIVSMNLTDTFAAGQREPVRSPKVKKQKAVVDVESFQSSYQN